MRGYGILESYFLVAVGCFLAIGLFILASCGSRCQDYSYVVSRTSFNPEGMLCDKRKHMFMLVETSSVHGTTIHCMCPDE